MKKTIVIGLIAGVCCLQSLSAQRNADFGLHWKYKDYPASSAFTIPGFVVKFASLFIKDKTERRLVRKIGKTRILSFEENNPVSEKDLKRMMKRSKVGGLTTLLTVRDHGENVEILVREKRNKIKKVLILASEADSFTLISVKCNINLDEIGALMEKTDALTGER